MGTYASQTTVSPERSRAEIERILKRYGATGFAYAWEEDRAMVAFKANERQVRFMLPIPPPEDYRRTPATRQWRSNEQMHKAHDQGVKQRWRALALSIKAKLEAVEAGIVTFEEEFLAHFVLPTGETVAERLGPQLATLGTKELPSLVPGPDIDEGDDPDGEIVAGEVVTSG